MHILGKLHLIHIVDSDINHGLWTLRPLHTFFDREVFTPKRIHVSGQIIIFIIFHRHPYLSAMGQHPGGVRSKGYLLRQHHFLIPYHPSGQIIIFHQHRFPLKFLGISQTKPPFWGFSVV